MASAAEMTQTAAAAGDACYCFLNAAAGSNSAGGHHSRIAEMFASFANAPQMVTPARGGIEAAVREVLNSGCKRIIAAGGDGTIHAVANVLAGTEAALAILPLGTLNHFARDLDIPLDLQEAVQTALTGHVRMVDVGEVNGRVFVNNSSIGLYPRVIREREAIQRKGDDSKWMAFVRACIGAFRRSNAVRVSIKFDGHSISGRSEFVFVGNNGYQFSTERLAARPRLDGGILWIWHVPHAGRFRAIAAAAVALLGKNPKSPLTFTTHELVLETQSTPMLVALDGETTELKAPLVFRIRPRALRVVVPAEATG